MKIKTNKFQQNDKYKARIDAHGPLPTDIFAQINAHYKITLTYSSNALSRNPLSLVDTKVILEDGLAVSGKIKDHLEVIGHADAYDEILKLSQNTSITEENIKRLHHLFYYRIDGANAGQYISAEVSKSIKDFVKRLPQLKADLHPVEYAAIIHATFLNLRPFINGNGHVARLLMNLALLQSGYNIKIIPLTTRADYIKALQDSSKNNFSPFVNSISEMVLESQKEYLKIIERLS